MERLPVRFKLHRQETNPSLTIKIEFWTSKVLVFGLTDKVEDYFVFDSFEDIITFIQNNYDVKI